jgi:glycine/D-amino acid oxidase-like deaminating enzyme
MKNYDAIILGGGIAGASIAYELTQKKQRVLVLDSSKIGSGGSFAAGAFISPKVSKPSPYKSYLNDSFNYTTNLYKNHFNHHFKQCGLLKYPLDLNDIKRLQHYEEFIELSYEKREKNYFFKDAGIVDTLVIKDMLDGVELKEDYRYKSICFNDGYIVDDFKAKHLIIATANIPKEFQLPYIDLKSIGGYRYDVQFDGMQRLSSYIHKDISISCFLDNRIIIGATHIKDTIDLADDAKTDRFGLLKKAREFYDMPDLKVLKHYTGYRVSTKDYFPIVGELIDSKSTLQKYPYIKKGSKVPSSKYEMFKNLYIHTALSSRGFVTAPYNAKLLANLILEEKNIDDRLSPVRLFKKWATTHQIV